MSKPKIRPDSFYHKVDKFPIKSEAKGFVPLSIVKVNSRRMEFRAGSFSIVLSIGLSILGISMMLGGLIWLGSVSLFFMGAFLLVSGGVANRSIVNPVIFDKNEGYFWVGKKAPWEVNDLSQIRTIGQLSSIYCVQIIEEYVNPDQNYPDTSRLMLVLKNGDRIFITGGLGGDGNILRKNGKSLAKFLKVPIFLEKNKSR